MLIAVCSVKDAPGVTTACLTLALGWPGPAVLVEADASGGDLAVRHRLRPDPGLASLATDRRRYDGGPSLIWSHVQPLWADVRVLLAPVGRDHARQALTEATPLLLAAASTATVIADLGRLDTTGPACLLLDRADHVLVLTKPNPEYVAHLQDVRPTLISRTGRVALVLTGPGYDAGQVSAACARPVAGELPRDAVAAAALCGGGRVKRLERRPLLRAGTRLAVSLAGQPSQPPSPDTSIAGQRCRSPQPGIALPKPVGAADARTDTPSLPVSYEASGGRS